jgi:hypothetical protein
VTIPGLRKWGLSLIFALGFAGGAASAADYRLVTDPGESARESATRLLALLAEGNIEAAARLSNAPQRRYGVLRDYRAQVGEEEFRRVYARYFAPGNRLMAEAAIGKRRLLIWRLGEAGGQLAGQYFVEENGRFVLDDVPHPERAELQKVLNQFRKYSP